MRYTYCMWCLLFIGFSGCQEPLLPREYRAGVCVGQGSPIGSQGNSPIVWTREYRNANLQLLVYEEWGEETRSARNGLQFRDEYIYTTGGLLDTILREFDNDGIIDLKKQWIRGDEDLLVAYRETQSDGSLLYEEKYTYNEMSELTLVEYDENGDGIYDWREQSFWEKGRLVYQEEIEGGSGRLIRTRTRDYLTPPPQLDHIEEIDEGGDGIIEERIVREYDENGALILVSGQTGEQEWLEEYTWDGDRLFSRYLSPDRQFLEISEDIVYLEIWDYLDSGLPLEQLKQWDVDGASPVEFIGAIRWEWVGCGDI